MTSFGFFNVECSLQTVKAMEDEEDLSVGARYNKYSYWNGVLEAEFLETLVEEYPSIYEEKSWNSFSSSDDCEEDFEDHESFPLIETDSWSLALLSEQEFKHFTPSLKENSSPEKASIGDVHKQLYQSKKRKNPGSRIRPPEDGWDDLYLVNSFSSSAHQRNSTQSQRKSPKDKAKKEVKYDLDMVEDYVLLKEEKLGHFADISNKVRDEIRKKILDSKDRNRVKIDTLNEMSKRLRPSKRKPRTLLEPFKVLTEADVEFSLSVLRGNEDNRRYCLRARPQKRLMEAEKKEIQTKKKFWYQQDPFDDPQKEAKRLRCLAQKIHDDRRRYEYEILKMENKDLREENQKLKQEIKRLLNRVQESESISQRQLWEMKHESDDSSEDDDSDQKLYSE